MEDKLKKYIKENRTSFDRQSPAPEIWERIKVQVVQQNKTRRLPNWRNWSIAAAILALLTTGVFWLLPQNQKQAKVATHLAHKSDLSKDNDSSIDNIEHVSETNNRLPLVEIATSEKVSFAGLPKTASRLPTSAGLDHQLDSVDEEHTILALLDNTDSAIKRIEGVLQASERDSLSGLAMEKLRYAMIHDPNSNVRLSAWELFMQHTPESEWDNTIQDIFVKQDDPSLQLELMQTMAYTDSIQINTATADKLQEITEDPLVIDLVKEQAYAVLMKTWKE